MAKLPYIASPMNYIGGKRKLLPQIIPLFPNNISTFVDIFCGGCNVGINVNAKKIIFNDNLVYLIDMYNSFLSNKKEDIIEYVENRINEFALSLTNNEGYIALRSVYNTNRNPIDLFVLVAYSFNHQIRFNTSHEYNNPFGKERSCYNAKMKTNLISFLDALHTKDVQFSCKDFKSFDIASLTVNDFVYADPPYLITTGTYNDGKRGFTGWNQAEEIALLDTLEHLNKRGVKFALSNVTEHKGNENIILKEWIEKNHFNVNVLSMNYKNSNYHTANCDKGKTIEVLVTNYNIENEIYR
jgi:DNA adenine methylase